MRKNLVHSLVTSSMEELQEELSAVAPIVTVHDTDAASDEAALDSIRQDVEDSEHLEEAAVALETIREAMNDALDEGGLNPQAERMATVAINNVRRQMGLRNLAVPQVEEPTLESAMPATVRTQISMEGVTQTLREMGRAIIEFIKRIWRRIVEFFQNLFSRGERFEERALALQERVRALAAKQLRPSHTQINLGQANAFFDIRANGVSTPADFLSALAKGMGQAVQRGMEASSTYADYAVEVMKRNMAPGNTTITGPNITPPKLPESVMVRDGSPMDRAGVPWQKYRSPLLPGHVVLICERVEYESASKGTLEPAELTKVLKNLGRETWSLEAQQMKTVEAIDVAGLNDLTQLTGAIIDAARTVKQFSEQAKELARENDRRIRMIEPWVARLGSDRLLAEQEKLTVEASRSFQRISRNFMGPGTMMGHYLMRCAAVYLQYVNACSELYENGQAGSDSKELAPA